MPDSKPNPRKVELLKEWLEDLLKPGYVNQRIESLKKAIYKNKASEEKFRYRFLDVTSTTVSEEQEKFRYRFLDVTSTTVSEEQEIKMMKAAGNDKQAREKFRYRFLDVTSTTVSEEQVCSDFNFNVVVTYCSSFAEELPTKKEVEAEDGADAAGTCDAEEGGEEEAEEEDECLPGESVESDAEKDATRGAFKDFGLGFGSLLASYTMALYCQGIPEGGRGGGPEEEEQEAEEEAEQPPEKSPEPPDVASKLVKVNRQNGASLGWTKFDSLAKAPGAWHFAAVADLSQLGL
eukprot:s3334_g2.t1